MEGTGGLERLGIRTKRLMMMSVVLVRMTDQLRKPEHASLWPKYDTCQASQRMKKEEDKGIKKSSPPPSGFYLCSYDLNILGKVRIFDH